MVFRILAYQGCIALSAVSGGREFKTIIEYEYEYLITMTFDVWTIANIWFLDTLTRCGINIIES
jgi:hypothetical protein